MTEKKNDWLVFQGSPIDLWVAELVGRRGLPSELRRLIDDDEKQNPTFCTIRCDEVYRFWLPVSECFVAGFAWKYDNGGTTVVAIPAAAFLRSMVGFTGGIDPAPRYIEGPLIYADGTLRFTKNGIAELFSNNHGAVMGHIYTRVFKKNDRVCVQTQRSDERDFIQDLAAKLPRIDALDLPLVLKSAIDIVCRLRGYKVEEVAEERVLWAGSLPPAEGDEVAAVIATLDD